MQREVGILMAMRYDYKPNTLAFARGIMGFDTYQILLRLREGRLG